MLKEQVQIYQDILNDAVVSPLPCEDETIRLIMSGKVKSYRYAMLTSLLAVTGGNHNPLALQTSSTLPRAYDARSLCHKVIVQHDLNDRSSLLRSREPFCSKPLRHPDLLVSRNSVRHKKELEMLISFLSKLDQRTSRDYLRQAVSVVLDAIAIENSVTSTATVSVTNNYLCRGGETAVLLTASLLLPRLPTDFTMSIHHVNQSGSSSRQVGDIDVHRAGELQFAVEVKDRTYSQGDILSAAMKVKESQANVLMFIYGEHASHDGVVDIPAIEKQTGVRIIFRRLTDMLSEHYLFAGDLDLQKAYHLGNFSLDTLAQFTKL